MKLSWENVAIELEIATYAILMAAHVPSVETNTTYMKVGASLHVQVGTWKWDLATIAGDVLRGQPCANQELVTATNALSADQLVLSAEMNTTYLLAHVLSDVLLDSMKLEMVDMVEDAYSQVFHALVAYRDVRLVTAVIESVFNVGISNIYIKVFVLNHVLLGHYRKDLETLIVCVYR